VGPSSRGPVVIGRAGAHLRVQHGSGRCPLAHLPTSKSCGTAHFYPLTPQAGPLSVWSTLSAGCALCCVGRDPRGWGWYRLTIISRSKGLAGDSPLGHGEEPIEISPPNPRARRRGRRPGAGARRRRWRCDAQATATVTRPGGSTGDVGVRAGGERAERPA
jgi:hypothetical protein